MGRLVAIECEELFIHACFAPNHAQQKALKPLYKVYILGFYFLFENISMQLSFIKPSLH
jgi:hypothetical protein